jgi:hypothetical protein
LSVRIDPVLIQAVIAAALSFAHLHDLAVAAGQDGWKAWAYPVSVDLLLVAAWKRLRSGNSPTAGRCWFLVALVASLGANVSTAGLLDLDNVPAWLRILVAGWPAVAFLGGTLLAHGPDERGRDRAELTGDTAKAEPIPAVVPELPALVPPSEPVADSTAHPGDRIPAALVEHARKVAAEHRTRTGAPIDTATLRARLGVAAPLAEAIAARIT